MQEVLHWDSIVIGGGPAGMMAAGRAAERGKRVLLLEKNQALGEKLKISGGGRCNITNAEDDLHLLLKHYGKAAQSLYSMFSQLGVADTFSFFERLGLSLIVEERKRAFPASQRSTDVIEALKQYMQQGRVTVFVGSPVLRMLGKDGRIIGVVVGRVTYTAESYIIATGGLSHPETGSTGDGFRWLGALGHAIAPPTATIVPLTTKERWSHALSGVSLESSKITFFVNSTKKFSKKGTVLFTHFGLSGPLILNSAAHVGDIIHEGVVTARIDAYPDIDHGTLEANMIKIFDLNKNKMIKNIINSIVPHGMARALEDLVPTIRPDTKVHSITREQRKLLVDTLKALPLTITGLLGFDKAVVVDGGIALSEIDTKTMRSTLFDNLFIIGDALHINRPSGGFSLQLCWTTGYVAGEHC